jgi:hypothetical protein
LPPLTGIEGGGGSLFEWCMPPEGIDLLRIGLWRAPGVPLARPQELHLDVFLCKEALFLGY